MEEQKLILPSEADEEATVEEEEADAQIFEVHVFSRDGRAVEMHIPVPDDDIDDPDYELPASQFFTTLVPTGKHPQTGQAIQGQPARIKITGKETLESVFDSIDAAQEAFDEKFQENVTLQALRAPAPQGLV